MAITKNGKKATALRNRTRMYLIDSGDTVEIIEVRPGVKIEDVDTLEVVKFPGWTCHSLVEAWRRTPGDGAATPGWYVCKGSNIYGPISNKKDTVKELRRVLAETTNRIW